MGGRDASPYRHEFLGLMGLLRKLRKVTMSNKTPGQLPGMSEEVYAALGASLQPASCKLVLLKHGEDPPRIPQHNRQQGARNTLNVPFEFNIHNFKKQLYSVLCDDLEYSMVLAGAGGGEVGDGSGRRG